MVTVAALAPPFLIVPNINNETHSTPDKRNSLLRAGEHVEDNTLQHILLVPMCAIC